ncbi:TetR/AcrR family transcriptional regulator (plasmid) [Embleya sp. NBC_00888]|uniref:TetR/AcrR family transcriptional regulator n=1 Tax=Embleya sp. NBC_00888 TaxID=2975960 RepID=UPI003868736A|nr:TetR/AcrR family transcriptional regulator [Embleya sp. NBC_00888]
MRFTDSAPSPRSRRARPAKPALTRQGIVDVALVIMREEGLKKVTMRRIATALDTGPASLYVYVRDTGDLHAQILDALLDPAAWTPPQGGTWRDRLKALLANYAELLIAHPELSRMALSTQPNGPNHMALAEAVLDLLREGGVSDHAAAWGLDLLLLHPTAIAVEHGNRESPGQRADDPTERIAAVDAGRYPNIARLGGELTSGDGPTRSNWCFDVLLDGIHAASARPRTP